MAIVNKSHTSLSMSINLGYDLISAGPACGVRAMIDRWQAKKGIAKPPTNVLDWVYSDFKTTIQVVDMAQKGHRLSRSSIQDTNKKWHNGNSVTHRVLIRDFDYFESIHDLKDTSDKSISDFVEKYNRRLERLGEKIRETNRLYFVHYGKPDENQIDDFLKKTPHWCHLVCAYFDLNDQSTTFKGQRHVLFNFAHFPYTDHSVYWKLDGYAWDTLFSFVQSHYTTSSVRPQT